MSSRAKHQTTRRGSEEGPDVLQPAGSTEVSGADLTYSDEHFRAIFEAAPIGISLTDVHGTVIGSNQYMRDILGYLPEELHGMTFMEFTHPDDVAMDWDLLQEVVDRKRASYCLEKRYVRKDGNLVWVRLTVSLVPTPDGGVRFVMAMVEDITDRKLAEQRLHEVMKQKDAFLSALAHDLRTPLTTLKGRVDLLRLQLDRGVVSPEELQAKLERLEVNISRMVTLINELLDVANLELGRSVGLSRSWIDLVSLARRVVDEHQDAEEPRIVLETVEPELIGLWDPARIERVLANLLSNAVKYSQDRGAITVRLTREGEPGSGWAVTAVQDQGIGIPAHDLPNVFDRFHRGENVTERVVGTGIGLATVKEIVEGHGGTVTVESQEGAGSTFTFRLPFGGLPDEGE